MGKSWEDKTGTITNQEEVVTKEKINKKKEETLRGNV